MAQHLRRKGQLQVDICNLYFYILFPLKDFLILSSRPFLALVAAVAVETMLLLALTVALAAEAFGEIGDFAERASDAFGNSLGPASPSSSAGGVKAILIVAGALLAGLVAMVLQLGGFHVMLGTCNDTCMHPLLLYTSRTYAMLLFMMIVSKGMTTYDFIVSEQRKQKARQIELRQQQQRASSGAAAVATNKTPHQITLSPNATAVSGVCNFKSLLVFYYLH